ncbi:MAG: hypothetical protein HY280_10960 [Nitrospinae bacterium]|nr:hypothetical protein [Nitrospinota bacterium]
MKIYERLKRHEMPESTARELAEILKENIEEAQSDLATKRDIKDVSLTVESMRQDAKKDIAIAVETLRKEMETIRKEMETIRKEMEAMKYDIIKWLVGLIVIQTVISKFWK